MACQNTAPRPPWRQAGSRKQGKPLTLDGVALDQPGKVQEMQGKGRDKARNSSTDFCGEQKRSQGFAGVWWPPGSPQWPSPGIYGPLGTNHTLCTSSLLWGLGCPVLGSLAHPSCFSLESLRVDAEHFWKIMPLQSVPFLQLPGLQTNKGKAKRNQDFSAHRSTLQLALSMTRFTWSGIISEANA